jgi:GNAT superfamily N-acetyltransferase
MLQQIKQNGLAYSTAIAFNRIVPSWLFRCRRFVIYQLDPNSVDLRSSSADNIRVRWCETESDYQALEKLTFFRRELSTGELQGCLAEIDGQNVGGFWAATQQFDEAELGIRIILDSNQAWLFAANVDKAFRRMGVYSQILAFIVAELANQGRNQPLVAVNPNNIGSNKIHQQHSLISPGWVFAGRTLRTSGCLAFGEISRDRMVAWNALASPIEIRIASADALEELAYCPVEG